MIALIIVSIGLGLAQNNIIIESIEFTETVDNQYLSYIPKLVDKANSHNEAVAKINKQILDIFMLESYKQEELSEFRWYEVNFQSEIQKDIAYIAFAAEYYGAYVSQVSDKLFFDLKTGELLDPLDIPFQALFRIDSYFDFISKYWLDDVNLELDAAKSCSGVQPSCSPYDINYSGYFEDELALQITLDSNCFNHALQACSPVVSKIITVAELEPYLNSFAIGLFKNSYFEPNNTEIDKYLYKRSKLDNIPNNIFIFGKIDGQYPFSMAINLAKNSNKISGYYYYDNNPNHEALILQGEYNEAGFKLQESVDNETTGDFIFTWSNEYSPDSYLASYLNGESLYLSGSWANPDKSKEFELEITDIKSSFKF